MTEENSPRVTVLMSAFNEEDWLDISIPSILSQTYTDFELLVIDDGSTDRTVQKLKQYRKRDPRVRIITQDNKGLPTSLNRGIDHSRGKFIARMDADNEASRGRLQKQVEFLENNIEYAMVGAWKKDVFEDSERTVRFPTSHEEIKRGLVRTCVFSHSSTMIRKSVLEKYTYRDMLSEDYDLWVRIAQEHRMHNIPEVLTKEYHRDNSLTETRDSFRTIKDLSSIHFTAYTSLEPPVWYALYLMAPLAQFLIPNSLIDKYMDLKDFYSDE